VDEQTRQVIEDWQYLPQLLGVSGTSVSVVDIARERRELQHPVIGKSML
jgi:hypothetical protein